MTVNRRQFLANGAFAALGILTVSRVAVAQRHKLSMIVYKSPSCGCCGKWVEYIEANGIAVEVKHVDDLTPIKQRYKVTAALQSCHTAVIEGYVIEGHVPAPDIKRLLAAKPKVVGLTIPGMPQSAPGMDGTPFKPYEVLSFDDKGSAKVFAKHTK